MYGWVGGEREGRVDARERESERTESRVKTGTRGRAPRIGILSVEIFCFRASVK